MMRHFRCLQEKKARQIAQKAIQNGRKEKERGGEGAGRRIRQRPTRLTRSARPRVDAHIGVRPSSREIRLEEGTNQSSEPARGDHVRPTTSRGLNSGGWAGRPVRGEGREQ